MRNSITSPADLFTLSHVNGKITLEADPDMARDLIYVISVLLELSKTIRSKVIHARAFATATNEEDIKRRQLEFKTRSSEIYRVFQKHLNNGCAGDKAAALQCIRKDFNLGYGEAKIYTIEGRRIGKEAKKAQAAPLTLSGKNKTAYRKTANS
jgi:hypothetical protein